MKNRKSYLFVLAGILVCLSSHARATACLPFDQTQAGTIGSAGQTNVCTFTASASDVIDFTAVTTSGNLSPEIRLYSSAGTLIAQAADRYPDGACTGGAGVELNTVTLPANDTYTVIISDCSGTNTGTYALYMQRTNNPTGAVNLPFNQTQTGSIASAAQNNTYTFSANANDVVDLTMVSTSGSLSSRIRLYNPAGKLLDDAADRYPDGACTGGAVVEMNTVTLASTGTYTVLVADCSDTNSGSYAIYAQLTNHPSGAANLPFSQAQSGTIASAAQDNSYTFSGSANEVVDFTMVSTSGSLSPRIRLYSPAGALLGDAADRYPDGACTGGSVVELDTVTLTQSGTYTVLVGDCGDTSAGNYDLYAQRTEKPTGGAVLPLDETQTGTIASAAQDKTYTFHAKAKDVVVFTMAATSGSLSPRIRLYSPAGKLLNDVADRYPDGACTGGSTVELTSAMLPSTGAYTVLAGDCSDTNTGTYVIYLQRTNNPSGAAISLFSQTQTGTTAAAGSTTYIFGGSAKDVIDFTMATTSGSLSPRIRLYSPAGALLHDAADRYPDGACTGGAVVELNTVTLPSNGTYTVLVGDCSDANTGNYAFYLQRTSNPFGPAPMLFGGQTQTGNIGAVAQDNTYIFGGSASNVVDFTMVATSGGLSPRLRLYNPDGTLIIDAANRYPDGACTGATTLSVNSVTLTQTGDYTMLVGDCSDTNNGNYNLSGLCFGTCPTTPAITWATPAAITFGTALSAAQLDATSPVAGKFVYTPAMGTVLAQGPQNLSVTFTPTDTTDYATAEDSVQLTVLPSPFSPASLPFGNQVIDTTSAAKTVTFTNLGTAPLTISNIAASTNFAISANACGSTLAVGKKCEVSVTFTPTVLGELTGALSITDSAPNSPQLEPMSGKGVLPAALTPASATYAKQTVGTTSAPKTFTLTNNQPETLTSIVITPSGDFAVSATTCTTSLAAKGHCTISVTFTPTATGTQKGTLQVSDSASNSPQTAKLTGTGK